MEALTFYGFYCYDSVKDQSVRDLIEHYIFMVQSNLEQAVYAEEKQFFDLANSYLDRAIECETVVISIIDLNRLHSLFSNT